MKTNYHKKNFALKTRFEEEAELISAYCLDTLLLHKRHDNENIGEKAAEKKRKKENEYLTKSRFLFTDIHRARGE